MMGGGSGEDAREAPSAQLEKNNFREWSVLARSTSAAWQLKAIVENVKSLPGQLSRYVAHR